MSVAAKRRRAKLEVSVEKKKGYYQTYRQREDVKQKRKEYKEREDVKQRNNQKKKEYRETEVAKQKQKEYRETEAAKQKKKEYSETEAAKQKKKEYNQREDVKQMKREYKQKQRQQRAAKYVIITFLQHLTEHHHTGERGTTATTMRARSVPVQRSKRLCVADASRLTVSQETTQNRLEVHMLCCLRFALLGLFFFFVVNFRLLRSVLCVMLFENYFSLIKTVAIINYQGWVGGMWVGADLFRLRIIEERRYREEGAKSVWSLGLALQFFQRTGCWPYSCFFICYLFTFIRDCSGVFRFPRQPTLSKSCTLSANTVSMLSGGTPRRFGWSGTLFFFVFSITVKKKGMRTNFNFSFQTQLQLCTPGAIFICTTPALAHTRTHK